MDKAHLKKLLELVKSDTISIDEGIEQLAELPFTDLGYAKIDNHRTLRVGYPEVIYCAGKTIEQVVGIVKNMSLGNNNILGTRASKEMYDEVLKICPDAKYNELAKTITVERQKIEKLFIPKDNLNDIEWLPKDLKSNIEFIPVSNYLEIYEKIFS